MTADARRDSPPDLTLCDREPIHIPGSVQNHGILLALPEPGGRITHASRNAARLLGLDRRTVTGALLTEIFGQREGERVTQLLGQLDGAKPAYLETMKLAGAGADDPRCYNVLAHSHDGSYIVELEPEEAQPVTSFRDLFGLVSTFMERLRAMTDARQLMQAAATEVRRLTGFDRVLIYKFDPSWNGHVLAEDRVEEVPSYYDLWFPASDIPKQARELYRLNRVRLLANAGAPAEPLERAADAPDRRLDLTYASLRSMSPVHIEYLHNMGICASMSISILRADGQLWGLISCHHRQARRVPHQVRAACDFLAQALSVQLDGLEQRDELTRRIELKSISTSLLAHMAQEDVLLNGLRFQNEELLRFVGASGAAVIFDGVRSIYGETPNEQDLQELVNALSTRGREDLFYSDCVQLDFPELTCAKRCPPGLLAISLSEIRPSYVLWFRPEVVRTVSWGGDPRKPVEETPSGLRLHPRKSFETWKETVRDRAVPWRQSEIDAVRDFRVAVIGIVLRKAEELAELTEELQRSNKELEAFSYSVSHDLRAPFRHIVGYAQLLGESKSSQLDERDRRYLEKIASSAHFAGTLVDNLLHFSQIGRSPLRVRSVDMNLLVHDVKRDALINLDHRKVEWSIDQLPIVTADTILLRLVWQNLVENALKYTRTREKAVIHIGVEQREKEQVFFIRDNGVGFDSAYKDKLFGVFQRLHRMEDYEGTGIGLANVRRIVARHGGRTWAEGEIDQGATFYFSLPHRGESGS